MKAVIICVYLGKLPESFPLWLKSCKYNPSIDFWLYTDQEYKGQPKNVYIKTMSLAEMRLRVENVIGFRPVMTSAYKICDCKPLYGILFRDEIKKNNYDYWGYCDLDMVFGDLEMFFKKYHIEKYEKFLERGHLCLFKNTARMNDLFKMAGGMSYKDVFSTDVPCYFDEFKGMQLKTSKNNIKAMLAEVFLDIIPESVKLHTQTRALPESYRILCFDLKNYHEQVLFWENGKAYHAYINSFGRVCAKEYIYIHFQKRHYVNVDEAINWDAFYFGREALIQKKASGIPSKQDLLNNIAPYNQEKEKLISDFWGKALYKSTRKLGMTKFQRQNLLYWIRKICNKCVRLLREG